MDTGSTPVYSICKSAWKWLVCAIFSAFLFGQKRRGNQKSNQIITFHQQLLENAFKKFSCQREIDLEDFLLHKAITYEKTNYGKTYLLIDIEKLKNKEFVVAAFYEQLTHFI